MRLENGHETGTMGVVQVKKLSRLLQPLSVDILNYEVCGGLNILFGGLKVGSGGALGAEGEMG